jgi:hypothetical protein
MQLAELDYYTGSIAGRTTLAENNVELPIEGFDGSNILVIRHQLFAESPD